MLRRRLAAIATALGAACGGGTTAPSSEVAYDFSFTDPVGDTTVATTNPRGVAAPDLRKISGTIDRDNATIRLEFASSVSRWSGAGADALDGFINFDLDESMTGQVDQTRGIGVDAYVDLRDDGSGNVALVNLAAGKITLLPGTWDGNAFQVKIPRPLLIKGRDNDNKFYLAVFTAGRDRRPNGDEAPDTDRFVVEPPIKSTTP